MEVEVESGYSGSATRLAGIAGEVWASVMLGERCRGWLGVGLEYLQVRWVVLPPGN